MKISAAAFSSQGYKLAQKLKELGLADTVTGIGIFAQEQELNEKISLAEWTQREFYTSDALIFISSCGIAVRAAAKHVSSKKSDPAVIVMDEGANFAVSLLSGHLGGANGLCRRIAQETGAQPVITTATDVRGVFSADSWAESQGMHIDDLDMVKAVSAGILEGRQVGLVCEADISGCPEELTEGSGAELGVCISYSTHRDYFKNTLYLIPKDIVVGIGCRKNTPYEDIKAAVYAALENSDIDIRAVKYIASADLKKSEEGIISFCREQDIEFLTFSADVLNSTSGSVSPSAFVAGVTGTDNVCERASLAAGDAVLISEKKVYNKVTAAISRLRREYSFEYSNDGN